MYLLYIYVFGNISKAVGTSGVMQQLSKKRKRAIDEDPDVSKVPRWEICEDGLLCAPDTDGRYWYPAQWAWFQYHHQQKAKPSTESDD